MSDKLAKIHNRHPNYYKPVGATIICPICKDPYTKSNASQVYCCDKCADRNHKKVMAEYRAVHKIGAISKKVSAGSTLEENIRKAEEAGMSYGQYQAMLYMESHPVSGKGM